MRPIRGVTLDFYETLVRGRHGGTGRGQLLMDYLASKGLVSDPWEHQVLYDLFEDFGRTYDPALVSTRKASFWSEFTLNVFKRLNVRGTDAENPGVHAEAVRDILGPRHFELFPDVLPAVHQLREDGYPLAIVSNWQKGLAHFCSELGMREYFNAIVSSAEVGIEKPDPRIFYEASRQLGIEPKSLVHVGDQQEDDVRGATEAGFTAVWLNRTGDETIGVTIGSLIELSDILPTREK
jgi:HAD superfamily hydrolase (TIGR01549 family)